MEIKEQTVERRKCRVVNCRGSKNSRHKFPDPAKYLGRFYRWVRLCGLDPNEIGDPIKFRSAKNFVCGRHFHESAWLYRNEKKLILRNDALPELYLPGQTSKSEINVPISLPGSISPQVEIVSCEETDSSLLSKSPRMTTPTACFQGSVRTYERKNSMKNTENMEKAEFPVYFTETEVAVNSISQNSDTFPDLVADEVVQTTQQNEIEGTPKNKLLSPLTIKVPKEGIDIFNPQVITSILDKANLKRRGTVHILPVKSSINTDELTSSKFEQIVQENATGTLKKRLLSLIPDRNNTVNNFSNKKSKIKNRKKVSVKNIIKDFQKNSGYDIKRNIGVSVKIIGLIKSDKNSPKNRVFSLISNISDAHDKFQIDKMYNILLQSISRLSHITQNSPPTAQGGLKILLESDTNLNEKSSLSSISKNVNAQTAIHDHNYSSSKTYKIMNKVKKKQNKSKNTKSCDIIRKKNKTIKNLNNKIKFLRKAIREKIHTHKRKLKKRTSKKRKSKKNEISKNREKNNPKPINNIPLSSPKALKNDCNVLAPGPSSPRLCTSPLSFLKNILYQNNIEIQNFDEPSPPRKKAKIISPEEVSKSFKDILDCVPISRNSTESDDFDSCSQYEDHFDDLGRSNSPLSIFRNILTKNRLDFSKLINEPDTKIILNFDDNPENSNRDKFSYYSNEMLEDERLMGNYTQLFQALIDQYMEQVP